MGRGNRKNVQWFLKFFLILSVVQAAENQEGRKLFRYCYFDNKTVINAILNCSVSVFCRTICQLVKKWHQVTTVNIKRKASHHLLYSSQIWALIVYGGITVLCGNLLSVQKKGEKRYLFYVPGRLKVGCTWHPFLLLLVLFNCGDQWWNHVHWMFLGKELKQAQCIPAVMCYTNRCCYNKNAYLF